MLRITRQIRSYPCKTVLEDVLTRTGSEFAFSPFPPMPELIDETFTGRNRENFVLSELLSFCSENDLNPSKVKLPEEIIGLELFEKRLAGYVTLEDMKKDVASARTWFKRQMIGYIMYGEYSKKYEPKDTYLKINYETGDEILERDLLVVEDDCDYDYREKILHEIPYLLKIIYNQSIRMNAHLISFLRAYVILSENKPESEIAPRDFGDFVLIRLKGNGTFDRYFDHEADNKGEDYPMARRFIMGEFPYNEAYKACMKLITYFEELGLDWANENPEDYDRDFFERLICTYIPSNEEYFDTYGNLDPEVAQALSPDNIYSLSTRLSYLDNNSGYSSESDTIKYIADTIVFKREVFGSLFDDYHGSGLQAIMKYIHARLNFGKPEEQWDELPSGFEVINGFVYLNRKLFKLSGEYIGAIGNEYPDVIFHEYGMAIVLPKRFEEVNFVSHVELMKRLKAAQNGDNYAQQWYSM